MTNSSSPDVHRLHTQPRLTTALVRSPSSLYRWSSRAVGVCGTLLVHALLFQVATLGASGPKSHAPEETGPGATAMVSGADLSMTLVLVQLPGMTHSDMLEKLASAGSAPTTDAIQVISPDPAAALEAQDEVGEENAEASQTVGDPAVRSLLFGRYTDQIDARIERAWRKPRSAVTDGAAAPSFAGEHANNGDAEQEDLFRCAARITQDGHGNVMEIELMRCNGTLAWQQSLVNAIQQASPLPAPPSPTVFTNALTLSFEGHSYKPGMSEDGYEPETYRLAQSKPDMSMTYPPSTQTLDPSLDPVGLTSDPGLPLDAPIAPRADTEF